MATIFSPTIALPLVAGTLCVLYFCYRRLVFRPIPGIPYNKEVAYTVLGDLPLALKAISDTKCLFPWIASQNEKHQSPIVQIYLRLFSRPWVIISDFRESQDILLRRTKEFDRSPATSELFSGLTPKFHIVMQSGNQEFKAHKTLIKDLMTPAFLQQVAAPQLHASVMNFVNLWSLKAQLAEGRPFAAMDDIFNMMLDSITAVAFGLDIQQTVTASRVQHLSKTKAVSFQPDINGPATFTTPARPPTYEALVTLVNSLAGTLQSPLPWLHHWVIRQTPSYRRAHKIKEDMINSELDNGVRRAQTGDTSERCALDTVLLQELRAAKKADRAPNYKTRSISDELFGFLIGGYDTTSTTMTWGYKYLSTYTAVQDKLRRTIRAAYPAAVAENRFPTVEEITKTNIPYLDATIEEIHRTAHTFSMTIRRAVVDAVVLGHTIPKGTDVGFLAIGPCFDSPGFPVPDSKRTPSALNANHTVGDWDPATIQEFKPERWLRQDENGNEIFDSTVGPHLAFGLGPRGCFGRRLAYLSMRFLLVLVFWKLEFLPVEGDEFGGFKPYESFGRLPVNCYMKLREIEVRGEGESEKS